MSLTLLSLWFSPASSVSGKTPYVSCSVSDSGARSWRCISEASCHAGASGMGHILASSAQTPERVQTSDARSNRHNEAIVSPAPATVDVAVAAGLLESGWLGRARAATRIRAERKWKPDEVVEDGRADVVPEAKRCLVDRACHISGWSPGHGSLLGLFRGARPWVL